MFWSKEKPLQFYKKYIMVFYGLLLSLFIGTIILYGNGFSFTEVCISNLGNPGYNPKGWKLFTTMFISSGLYLIPFHIYLFKRLRNYFPIWDRVWIFLLFLGDLGIILVGIFNETLGLIHIIAALLAFGGLGVALFLSIIFFSINVYKNRAWPSKIPFLILMSVLGGILLFLIHELINHGFDIPKDLNPAEWAVFSLILIWQIGILFLIEKKEEINDR